MNKEGFNLIEVLISISIMVVLISFSFPFYSAWQDKSSFNNYKAQIIGTLELARLQSLAGFNNKSHGIYFNLDENTFVLFQGNNYESRDLIYDREFELPSNIFLTTNLDNNEIVFNKYTALVADSGIININEKNTEQNSVISVSDFSILED